jgi:hypothetical protein
MLKRKILHFSVALPAHSEPGPLIQFPNHFFTDGRTPWTSDQSVARPLPKHRTTHTQNKRTQRQPCLQRDSNLRSQRPSERRRSVCLLTPLCWIARNTVESVTFFE